jgi:hypothetical protein
MNYGPAEGKLARRIETEDEFLDDFRPLEEGKTDEENGEAALPVNGTATAGTAKAWEKRAEKELENGIQEPPAAKVV